MICVTIECDDCTALFDLEFDDGRIILARESARVQLEDAELERFNDRNWGRCPNCWAYTPLTYLVGIMADAIEEKGVGWLRDRVETENRYQAGPKWTETK
jgi:hypothetical protein